MKKSDYRKFIIRTVVGNDDFASMREVITRRYSKLQQEKQRFPGLVLVDGGLGQLHAAAEALEAHRHHRSAARIDRQTGRMDLCLRPGRRTHCSGQVSRPSSPGSDDPRRGASLRSHVSSHSPQCAAPLTSEFTTSMVSARKRCKSCCGLSVASERVRRAPRAELSAVVGTGCSEPLSALFRRTANPTEPAYLPAANRSRRAWG